MEIFNAGSCFLGGVRRLRDAAVGAALTGGDPTWAIRTTNPARITAALAGRTVLVTGASSGIGRAVALKAADAGARVVLSCDRLHDYERTMALNYFGSLRLILGLLPDMRARKHGHVINVSSAGAQMATPMFSAYVASKAALDAFTRVAATEAGADGVHFTTVYMPLVRTPMIAPTAEYRDAKALTPEQAADLVLSAVVTQERELGMSLAKLFNVGHVVAPETLEAVLGWGHRMLSHARSRAANDHDGPESTRAA